jgi:hypothetical protein
MRRKSGDIRRCLKEHEQRRKGNKDGKSEE